MLTFLEAVPGVVDLLPMDVNPFPRFVFVDCEATSLDRPSHPIEVGLAWCDGNSSAHLVRPAAAWTDWVWSPAASMVHRIRREETLANGRSVEWISDWLNQACGGRIVCSDNPAADGYWLSELFEAAGRTQAFKLEDGCMLVQAALAKSPQGPGAFDALKQLVAADYPITHRAADDALFWAVAFREAAAHLVR